MSSFSAINLDQLPAPEVIEQLDFETIFQARKARLIELAPDLAQSLELESEPLVQLLQEDSFRELLLRRAIQDAGQGVLLAFASGAMLDHLAAFYGVARQIVQEADATVTPPIPEIKESDGRLRARVQLAPEGFTTAGSKGSYMFWGMSASTEVKDIAVLQTENPGEVQLVVLSTEGDGTPNAGLLTEVDDTTQPRRPLTDQLIVSPANITTYDLVAELTLYEGPDAEVVRQAAQDAIEKFVQDHHLIGHDITVSGLHSALHQAGVQNVSLTQPAATIVVGHDGAAFCNSVTVTVGGRDV